MLTLLAFYKSIKMETKIPRLVAYLYHTLLAFYKSIKMETFA